jgi:hypothetical protein
MIRFIATERDSQIIKYQKLMPFQFHLIIR